MTVIITILLGVAAGLASGVTSWRINLLALHRLGQRGRIHAFLFGFGAVIADAFYLALVVFGFDRWIDPIHIGFLLKFVGAGTLLLLAAYCFRANPRLSNPSTTGPGSVLRSFFKGFGIVLGTPALILVWMGVISFIYAHFSSFTDNASFSFLFPVAFVMGNTGWYLGVLWLVPERLRVYCQQHVQFFLRGLGLIFSLSAIVVFLGSF